VESKIPTPGTILLVSLLVACIDENPNNPRQEYDLEELQSLGQSLQKHQKTPIRVYAKANGRYGLIAGHRRLRAARMVGLETLQALVEPEPSSADQVIEDQLVEQMHHTDYTVVEQTEAIIAIMQARACDFDAAVEGMDIPPSTLAKIRALLNKLSKELLARVLEKKLAFSSAYLISRVPDAGKQVELANLKLKRSSLELMIDEIIGNPKKANKPVTLTDEKSKSKAEIKGADKIASARAMIDILKRWIAERSTPVPSAN
jgi:ParB family transcriptional regulator, chromosome partitioning protein